MLQIFVSYTWKATYTFTNFALRIDSLWHNIIFKINALGVVSTWELLSWTKYSAKELFIFRH